MRKITDEDILALRARGLPRCNWRTLFNVTNSNPDDPRTIDEVMIADGYPSRDIRAEIAVADAYFRIFVQPGEGGCVHCNTPQGGGLSAILQRGFTWGIAHGEGFCLQCGYPARAAHYNVPIFNKGGRFDVILQYHPDEVVLAAERETRK